MLYTCPVCGFDHLTEPPLDPSFEICPSCRFQFGVHDMDRGITFEQWREKWIAGGMMWSSKGMSKPLHWNPRKQLLNVGVKI